MNSRTLSLLLAALAVPTILLGQAAKVDRLPPAGIQIAASDRTELEQAASDLAREIHDVEISPALEASSRELLPDVKIFHKAVDWALRYNEFFASNEVRTARTLLKEGSRRAASLKEHKPEWTSATGLVVRAYVSRIDGSIQPYGLIVPATFNAASREPRRLDIWMHGRDEKLTELKFVNERMRTIGEFAPSNTFVLHVYGRYCNASKFAGEIDLLEAMEAVKKNYPIDENRIVVRGFSMGGGSTWHIAVHYAGLWAAANPGAGFADSATYLKLDRSTIPWYEQKLWHLYDSVDYALNLAQCPVIAYSGEIDPQKLAADTMVAAAAAEGIKLTHVIGPKTAHKYEPEAKREVSRLMDEALQKGRAKIPSEIHFTTYTLRYNQMRWITIDRLEKHWERARIDASLADNAILATTTNISALTFDFGGMPPAALGAKPNVVIDGQKVSGWAFHKENGKWMAGPLASTLAKSHGLQGPIDDAFMDSFIFVRPTGKSPNSKITEWVDSELARAAVQWRNQFRGDVRIKNDTEITPDDIRDSNLVLWGDPESNAMIAKIAGSIPIQWSEKTVRLNDQEFPASRSALVMVYPNPLNPKRYIVLNSSFTFRGFGSNADQTPKLPDYAVINVETPASLKAPGGILTAGFFNEQWR